MTIIVEDGSQVTGSNSYVSADELTVYSTERGIMLSTDNEELIIKSMEYLESLFFIGYIVSQSQSLQWPRNEALLDGYYILNTSIPKLLKNAQMSICLEIEAGNNPLSTIKHEKQSVKIGPISTTYKTGSNSSPNSRIFLAYLQKLLSNRSGFSVSR